MIFSKAQEIIKLYEEGNTCLHPKNIENIYEIIGNMLQTFKMEPVKIKEILQYYFGLFLTKISEAPIIQGNIEVIRMMNYLIKPLSKHSASESKEILIEMSENLLKVFQNYINTPILECIVYLQKCLGIVGSEMLEIVNNYMLCLHEANTQVCLDNSIRIVNYTIIELDENGFLLFDAHIKCIFERI